MSKTKAFVLAAVAIAGTLAAGVAAARDNVYWSVGIHAPLDPYGASIGTTISNARPVYVAPAPVYYAPPPVYVAPPPVVYRPAPVYYAPAPVYVPQPVYYDGWRGHHHHKKHWKKHRRHGD